MSAETTPAQGFPTPCTRCGGVLYQHVEFCPYCGADHPLERAPRKRAATQLRAVDTQSPPPPIAAVSAGGAVTAASAGELAALTSPDIPIPPLDLPQPFWQVAGHWIATKGVVLLLFLGALGYAGYLLLGDGHKQDTSDDDTATASSSSTSGGSISPWTPQAARNTPSANVTNVPVQNQQPARVAPARPAVAQHFRNEPDAIRAARAALAHNNLADAKAAVADAMSLDPNNDDTKQLQGDIREQEARRNAALNVANTCAKDKLWSCVRDNAAKALAIDVSSADAQALLERVILSTGWKPLANAVPVNAASVVDKTAAANAAPALPPLPPGMAPKTVTPAATGKANAPAATANVSASANTTADAGNSADSAANNMANSAANSTANSAASGVDAQMRAILESGWKQSPAKKQ